MNGIHDLGGMDGFGPVEVEDGEPVFHTAWERCVFGLAAAVLGRGIGNAHAYRHAIERMDPAHYLLVPYYERMMTGIATLLVEHGIVTRAELETCVPRGFPLGRPAKTPRLADIPTGTVTAKPDATPRFVLGDTVRVRNVETPGHTRCPRYVRGKRGTVVRVDRRFSLPDLEAHTGEQRHEHTYAVRFTSSELWGAAAGAGETIHVDLWESYLEPERGHAGARKKPPSERGTKKVRR